MVAAAEWDLFPEKFQCAGSDGCLVRKLVRKFKLEFKLETDKFSVELGKQTS